MDKLSDDLIREWKSVAEQRLNRKLPPDMGTYRAIIDLCETILIERHPIPPVVFPNLLHHEDRYTH